MSKDDYHSITPWNSQERFFFTRPTAHKRRRPRPPRDKFFVGDQDRCLTGSCEFFLFCWLAGGVVEGGCGGFLQSCCNRPNQVGHKTIVTQVGPKLGQLTVIWTPSFSCDPPSVLFIVSYRLRNCWGSAKRCMSFGIRTGICLLLSFNNNYA